MWRDDRVRYHEANDWWKTGGKGEPICIAPRPELVSACVGDVSESKRPFGVGKYVSGGLAGNSRKHVTRAVMPAMERVGTLLPFEECINGIPVMNSKAP